MRARRDVVQDQVVVADLHVGDAVGARACGSAAASCTRACVRRATTPACDCNVGLSGRDLLVAPVGDRHDVRVGARLAKQRRRRRLIRESLSVGRPRRRALHGEVAVHDLASPSSLRRRRPTRATVEDRPRTPADRRAAARFASSSLGSVSTARNAMRLAVLRPREAGDRLASTS